MRNPITIRIATFLVALTLVAAACSNSTPTSEGPLFDPAEPTEEPDPGPSASPTPTPESTTPTPLPLPTTAEPEPQAEHDDDAAIEAAVAALQPPGSPGVIVRIDAGGRTLVDTAVGEVAIGGGEPLTSDHPFRIASTTKPITAAAVLRLEEQGLLDIDDPISGYIPADLVDTLHVMDGTSRGAEITIRHLLTHTAGLADRPFETPFVDTVGADPSRVWEPRELVEYTIAHADPRFPPGERYHYSDDGYVLLGMIIETVTGQPLHEVYRTEIFDPLGMDGTYLEGHEAARGPEMVHPYIDGVDGAAIHPSTDWGGGGLVSTVADLVRFGTALDNASVFADPATLDEMVRTDGSEYGLGIYVTPLGPGVTALAHDGFWGSVLLVVPEVDVVVAATMSQFVEEADRQAFFVGLLNLTEQLLLSEQPERPVVSTVEVQGRTTAYVAAGDGGPTVVFEAGFGDGLESWAATAGTAAEFTRTFVYDRAGYGDSALAEGERDGQHIVDDLRAALIATGHQPPYVLVGHSMGGMYAELFARTHPDEVVGLVLVDATPAGYFGLCADELGDDVCGIPFDLDELPEPARSEAQGVPPTEDQVGATTPRSDIPTVILVSPASDGRPDTDAIWLRVQQDRATAIGAEFVIAEESGHYIQRDQPELVIDAIRTVIEGAAG